MEKINISVDDFAWFSRDFPWFSVVFHGFSQFLWRFPGIPQFFGKSQAWDVPPSKDLTLTCVRKNGTG